MLEKIKRIDFFGTITLILSVICLLLALNWGGTEYEWSSGVIIGLFIGFVVLLIIFLIIEYKFAKEPIVPFSIFKNIQTTLSFIVTFFTGVTFLTAINSLPLLYQDGRNISATYSGLRIMPTSITITVASIGSGILISKFGHVNAYIQVGSLLTIISGFLITLIDVDTKIILEIIYLALFGLGVGCNMQNTIIIAQESSTPDTIAINTSVLSFFRIIGGVVGVALFGNLSKNKFISSYENDHPGVTDVSINRIHELDGGEKTYVDAINFSHLLTIFPAAIFSLIFALFIKNVNLRKENEEIKKTCGTNSDEEFSSDICTEVETSTEITMDNY